jgi:multiple sugar transport system substrate-binding protein
MLMFRWPPAVFENYVIDHREIHEECKRKYGKPIEMAVRSTYNPKNNKYFAFSPGYMPVFINYRKDLWDDVGIFPGTWEDIRSGGQKIKQKHGNSIGIGLNETDYAMNAIMYSFGASVQDEMGNVVINSKETLEAVRFVNALFEESMIGAAIWGSYKWHINSMILGELSLTSETNIITRTVEMERPEMSKKIQLAKTPEGPVCRLGSNRMACYLIWKFAENIEGAKQFLVDYVGNFQRVFTASGFLYFPCFPNTVLDMEQLLANDSRGQPPTKYKVLEDVAKWTTNTGYPGYANAAINEITGSNVISKMFRDGSGGFGNLTVEEAVKKTETECKRIFTRWKEKGLL